MFPLDVAVVLTNGEGGCYGNVGHWIVFKNKLYKLGYCMLLWRLLQEEFKDRLEYVIT